MRILFFFTLPLLLASACGPDHQKETFTVETIEGKEVIVGKVTGLMWQSYTEGNVITYLKQIAYDKAEQYCADLEWAGFTDWRLPTIDELRTIVEGYDDVEQYGRCKVSEKCLAYACKEKGADDENDHPCANNENQGTGPGPGGCYWAAVWHDRFCGPHWSTSPVTTAQNEHWVLDFYSPAIYDIFTTGSTAFPRCVRER